MGKVKTYNFYGFLEVKCNFGNHEGYEQYFNNEYTRIADTTAKKAARSITVNIVKNLPSPRKSDISNTVTYKKLFDYSYLIRNINGKNVEIYFKTHPVDKIYMNAIGVFLQAQVLEPVMYLKFLEEGIVFMHAGGVASDTAGYILPAYGGTGKTTFSIALLNHGYKLLGDDLLIIDTSKKIVYPYPRPLHLFTYNINNLNGADVPFKYKAIIYTKNGLRYVLEKSLNTEFLISTRVHADEIFSRQELFAKPVPYRALCFLRKNGNATAKKVITRDNVSGVAAEIMESADLNSSLYELLGNDDKVAEVKKLEHKILEKLLLQFPSITYVNTRKLNLQSLHGFISKHFKVGSKNATKTALASH